MNCCYKFKIAFAWIFWKFFDCILTWFQFRISEIAYWQYFISEHWNMRWNSLTNWSSDSKSKKEIVVFYQLSWNIFEYWICKYLINTQKINRDVLTSCQSLLASLKFILCTDTTCAKSSMWDLRYSEIQTSYWTWWIIKSCLTWSDIRMWLNSLLYKISVSKYDYCA